MQADASIASEGSAPMTQMRQVGGVFTGLCAIGGLQNIESRGEGSATCTDRAIQLFASGAN